MENPFSIIERRLNRLEDLILKQGEQLEASRQKDLTEKFLSPAEASKLFNPAVSKATLNRWSKAGRLKLYRLGGRTFYKYSEVIAAAGSLQRYKH